MAAVPGALGSYYMPGSPFSVPTSPGYFPLIGPGDPSVIPHARLVEDFIVTPSIPEPSSWMLLILGFGVLGWRMSLVRRRAA